MLKIYGVPISVHTRKVIVAALAKAVPYELVPVVPVVPGNPPANWRELSPTGLIPAITDGDFTLADSAAICAYLERLHPAAPLYPEAAREHARVLSLEQYAGTLFRDVVHPLFHEVFVHPRIHQRRNDAALVDAAQRLQHIESRIAQLDAAGGLSDDDVLLRDEPACRVVSLRRTVGGFGEAVSLIGEMRRLARPLLPRGSKPALIAVSHSPQFEQDEIDIEFAWTLEPAWPVAVPAGSPLVLRELEAARMAVCVKAGPPQDAHLAAGRIGRFLQTRGEQLAGPSREVFLQPPDLDRMHEALVEMQFPVEPLTPHP